MLILGSSCTQAFRDLSKSSLNYGVLFRHHHSIQVAEGMWRITFSRKLPTIIDVGPDEKSKPTVNSTFFTGVKFAALANCAAHTRVVGAAAKGLNCAKYMDSANFIKDLGKRAQTTLIELGYNIRNNLPHQLPKNWNNKRVIGTRAILSFVSELGKSLFGFSTNEDLEAVKTAVNELIKNQEVHDNTLRSSTQHLATFAGSVNNEFERILGKINANEAQTLKMLEQS